jgi:hypothetical protein
MIEVLLFLVAGILFYYYMYIPYTHKKKCQKLFQRSPEYRDSTKCFDCVNNSKSLNNLNVSYGHPNIYAT